MKAKFRPPAPGLNEPAVSAYVAEKLDAVQPQAKQETRVEQRQRFRAKFSFRHPHGGFSWALCLECEVIATHLTTGMARPWRPKFNVAKAFRR